MDRGTSEIEPCVVAEAGKPNNDIVVAEGQKRRICKKVVFGELDCCKRSI